MLQSSSQPTLAYDVSQDEPEYGSWCVPQCMHGATGTPEDTYTHVARTVVQREVSLITSLHESLPVSAVDDFSFGLDECSFSILSSTYSSGQ